MLSWRGRAELQQIAVGNWTSWLSNETCMVDQAEAAQSHRKWPKRDANLRHFSIVDWTLQHKRNVPCYTEYSKISICTVWTPRLQLTITDFKYFRGMPLHSSIGLSYCFIMCRLPTHWTIECELFESRLPHEREPEWCITTLHINQRIYHMFTVAK